jgi:transcriptional regulator with XRE-family HTH domain
MTGPDRAWLSTHAPVEQGLNTELLAEILREYRQSTGMNQADLAKLLNLDQSYVSKIETGQRHVRDLETLLRIANRLNIPPSHLGVSTESLNPVSNPATSALVGAVDPVDASQGEWRKVRRYLNRHRGDLARAATGLYRREFQIGDVPLIARPEWIPERPVKLEDIQLEWSDEHVRIPVTGTEPEAEAVLPLRAPGRRFDRYTSAIRYLDPPSLFENRTSYRLLDAELSADGSRLQFGLGTYFDKLDASEAAAHELAQVVREKGGEATPDWQDLPLRGLIGDPFDLTRRAVMPAIETLTLRRSVETGEASFPLHWRDPAKVATAGGIYGLIPSGEFQPSTVASWDKTNDFDMWRNVVREYSEELLGEPERDGSQGVPLDYDNWSLYRDMQKAREERRITAYCLGLGLDALTLTGTLLTVVVFDSDVFDDLFGDAVQVNSEGTLVHAAEATAVSAGVPFDEASVRRLLTSEPMASPGACILSRAWQFRDHLLTN